MKDKVLYNMHNELLQQQRVPKESMHKSYGPIFSTRDKIEMWALKIMDGIKELFGYLIVIALVTCVWIAPALYALLGDRDGYAWAICVVWSIISLCAFVSVTVSWIYQYLKERKTLREKRGLCG